MLRSSILLVLLAVGCGGGAGGSMACPDSFDGAFGDAVEGGDCPALGLECFVVNQFSTCSSGTYRCTGDGWARVSSLTPAHGEDCTDAPLDSCSFEGNPVCGTPPETVAFTCIDGRWRESCACYGGDFCGLDCPIAPPTTEACGDVGQVCSYADRTCTCDGATGTFACS